MIFRTYWKLRVAFSVFGARASNVAFGFYVSILALYSTGVIVIFLNILVTFASFPK